MTGDGVLDLISALLLVNGGLLSVTAGLALVRFPDLMSRMHAATKPQVLGLLSILTGAALQVDELRSLGGLALVALFQLVTAPVAAHVISRTAYRGSRGGRGRLIVDELESGGPPD